MSKKIYVIKEIMFDDLMDINDMCYSSYEEAEQALLDKKYVKQLNWIGDKFNYQIPIVVNEYGVSEWGRCEIRELTLKE